MSTPRTDALRLLGRRDYSTEELREKLLAKDHPPDAVQTTIDGLTADGLLDDRRVALGHVRTASQVKGRGRLRIIRELEARGVPSATIRDALETLPAEDERAALERVLARSRLPARPAAADQRRLFARLMRRGYSADLIARALRDRRDD